MKKVLILKIITALISIVLILEFVDYFVSLLIYSHDVWGHEAISARLSLSFIENGLRFTNLYTYPYILTMYGFFYELSCIPLFYILGPTINCGRIISFISIIIIIFLLFRILRKKGIDIYFAYLLSVLIILFKPSASLLCYSKPDAYAALFTAAVLFSLYFHKGGKKFIITLIFSSLALMTKQTTVFIIPVVLIDFFIKRENQREFYLYSSIWLLSLCAIFSVLFWAIPNYFYNTFILTSQLGTLHTGFRHLIFNQIFPLGRSFLFLILLLLYIFIRYKPNIKEILSPSLMFVLFYIPVFILTSYNTGSEPVYYIFIFIGISIFLGELIIKYELQKNLVLNSLILFQLLILLIYPSKLDALRFTYSNKPSREKITQAAEVGSIISGHDVRKSYATLLWSSYGLSKESANNYFGMFHDYLLESGKLNYQPIINDFKEKKFSIIVGSLDYPVLSDALNQNYYLFKTIGDTRIYLPK